MCGCWRALAQKLYVFTMDSGGGGWVPLEEMCVCVMSAVGVWCGFPNFHNELVRWEVWVKCPDEWWVLETHCNS